ncbi:MAG: class I SAM-dependent methyltransferase [Acidimicrobiia bacterium]|nr:class I SAM-dependent methyltransferase [Acidimicrobiia bacterium]
MTSATVESRATRIAALPFDPATEPVRTVTRCNLCGGSRFVVIAHRDRYGYRVEAHACDACGLVFLNPVMTAEAYGRFYRDTYRPLVSAFHGRLIDATTIQGEQREYAAERAALLAPWLAGSGLRTLLDIGGSTGIVAHHLAERFGLDAAVLDPAPLEVDEARKLGLETIAGLVEEYDPGDRRFDVVALFQTVDHLLDVGGTLARVRALINPNGIFFVDIVDFRAAYLRNRSVEAAIKVDHPYYLTEDTMTAYLQQAGFEVLRTDFAADHLHVSYVCRPDGPKPGVRAQPGSVRELLREIRAVQNAPSA